LIFGSIASHVGDVNLHFGWSLIYWLIGLNRRFFGMRLPDRKKRKKAKEAQ